MSHFEDETIKSVEGKLENVRRAITKYAASHEGSQTSQEARKKLDRMILMGAESMNEIIRKWEDELRTLGEGQDAN